MATERPDNAIEVGQMPILCPGCKQVVPLPVFAWMELDGTIQSANASVDVDPMWEHSMLTHPKMHL